MFSHLRAVEDLEPLPLSEAEVILGPGFVVIQSHKQGHSCGENGARTSSFSPSYDFCFPSTVMLHRNLAEPFCPTRLCPDVI